MVMQNNVFSIVCLWLHFIKPKNGCGVSSLLEWMPSDGSAPSECRCFELICDGSRYWECFIVFSEQLELNMQITPSWFSHTIWNRASANEIKPVENIWGSGWKSIQRNEFNPSPGSVVLRFSGLGFVWLCFGQCFNQTFMTEICNGYTL